MNVNDLTNEQKVKITKELLAKEPVNMLAELTVLKLTELCIETGANEIEQSISAVIKGKKYKCNMNVTYELDESNKLGSK